jgi:L-fucose isomerase-like protein
MKAIEARISFGLIVGSRAFFNGSLALEARRDLLAQLERLGIGAHLLPVEASRNGAVETPEDVERYVRLFRERRDEIDGVVVVLPNFGDEIAVAETLRRAGLGVPVLVQACDDELSKVDLKGRRDAFCGKLSVCNNLVQYGIPFSDTTLHTCDVGGALFAADLDRFARTCRVVRGLRRARIGCIGARTAPFQTVRFSEKILQASGITVVTVDLSEILGEVGRLGEQDPEVKRRLEEVDAYGRIPPSIKRENVVKQARLGVVVDRWMERHGCDASAIQCWDSVQENLGCATCLSMSMMGEKLMPSACETDVAGAVSMYALALAAGQPSALLDWNNNYAKEADLCVCTHCGNFPRTFMGTVPELSNLDVIGATVGPEKCFGAVKGKVAAGPMTYFRVSTDDLRGRVKAYLGQGEFTDHPFGMDGGIAVTRVPKLRKLLGHLCREGFEHHVAMVRGQHAAAVDEAVSRYLGWELYHHEAEAG